MTYFEDLSDYNYTTPSPGTKNIGWLSATVPFSTGETSELFRANLSRLCTKHIVEDNWLGFHECEFCLMELRKTTAELGVEEERKVLLDKITQQKKLRKQGDPGAKKELRHLQDAIVNLKIKEAQIHDSRPNDARGSGEIRVKGINCVYAAPVMIYHYVRVHGYKPPQEFIEAVISGGLDTSNGATQNRNSNESDQDVG